MTDNTEIEGAASTTVAIADGEAAPSNLPTDKLWKEFETISPADALEQIRDELDLAYQNDDGFRESTILACKHIADAGLQNARPSPTQSLLEEARRFAADAVCYHGHDKLMRYMAEEIADDLLAGKSDDHPAFKAALGALQSRDEREAALVEALIEERDRINSVALVDGLSQDEAKGLSHNLDILINRLSAKGDGE